SSRAMTPQQMDQHLRPIFKSLCDLGTPIVHYKVCSTFDSSPQIGSIGKVIEIGIDIFKTHPVPVLAGAPSLGRHCVFGNLFARLGAAGEIFRLDRHPSISRHPVTPMQEADLRTQLAKQTSRSVDLLNVLNVDDAHSLESEMDVLLVDVLHERQLANIGRLLDERSRQQSPLFVVGSSGVESALAAYWNK